MLNYNTGEYSQNKPKNLVLIKVACLLNVKQNLYLSYNHSVRTYRASSLRDLVATDITLHVLNFSNRICCSTWQCSLKSYKRPF